MRAARKLNRHVIFKSLFAKHYQIIGPYLSRLQRAKKLAHSVHRQLVVGPNCQAGSVAQRCPASLPGSLLVAADCQLLRIIIVIIIRNSKQYNSSRSSILNITSVLPRPACRM